MASRGTRRIITPSVWEDPWLLKEHTHWNPTLVEVESCKKRMLDVLVIPQYGSRPEIWEAPSYTTESGRVVREELDLRLFFPEGSISTLFCTIPGSGSPLPFSYRVYLDSHRSPCPRNKAIGAMFKRPWVGNIVVVRYARATSKKRHIYAHIQRPEAELIVALLGDWLANIWSESFDTTH